MAVKLKLIVISFMITMFSISPGLAAADPAPTPPPAYFGVIGLNPAQITVTPGETFTISIDIVDPGVTYNSAQIYFSLGNSMTLVGADFTGSAFNEPETAKTVPGTDLSCGVVSASSTTDITGNSHLASVQIRASNTFQGSNISGACGSPGNETYVNLNGWQANQDGVRVSEVFVNLASPQPTPTTVTKPTPKTPASVKSTNKTTTKSLPTPSSGKTSEAGEVQAAHTQSSKTNVTQSPPPVNDPTSKVPTHLATLNKGGISMDAIAILVVILIAAVAWFSLRLKNANPE